MMTNDDNDDDHTGTWKAPTMLFKKRSTHSRTQYTLTHYTFRSFETNTRRNTRYWYYSGTVLLTLQVFVVLWNCFIDRIGLRNRHRNRTQTVKS